jgi:hypothetical protein
MGCSGKGGGCGRGKELGVVNECAEDGGRGFDAEGGGFDGGRYILLGGSESGVGWLGLDEAHHGSGCDGGIGERAVGFINFVVI